MVGSAEKLQACVARHCPERSQAWWESALASAEVQGSRAIGAAFAGAGRRLGDASLTLPAGVVPHGSAKWSLGDVGRVVLALAALCGLDGPAQQALISDLYFRGSLGEKRAILLGLPLFPAPHRFLALAVEACRTNAVTLFEALACRNPCPAQHFSEAQFNQLVLKTVFLELDVRQIMGLEQRVNAELIRQLEDFATERQAAGRTVPAGIAFIVSQGFEYETI